MAPVVHPASAATSRRVAAPTPARAISRAAASVISALRSSASTTLGIDHNVSQVLYNVRCATGDAQFQMEKSESMVYVATRGDVPVRLGPGAQQLPDYGPSI